MGKPRTPTNVLELSGAFKKNPARGVARGNEPEPSGAIGDPPERFNEEEAKAWREIVSILPDGVAYNSDRMALELTASLMARFRTEENFPIVALTRLHALLGSFGMTPADRSKINVGKKNKSGGFDEF